MLISLGRSVLLSRHHKDLVVLLESYSELLLQVFNCRKKQENGRQECKNIKKAIPFWKRLNCVLSLRNSASKTPINERFALRLGEKS